MKRHIRNILYITLLLLTLAAQAWADQWKISFNGYPGTMELSGSANNYTGRFNLHGSWEQMLDLRVYRNAIFFRRAAADQKYLGIIEGNRMQGIFSQGGSGNYPWTAEQMDSVAAEPIAATSSPGSNIALKKSTRQSSTGYGGSSARAVDGNRDGNYNANSVTHTNNSPNEWWEVDLGHSSQIREVRIWNRTDCCSERLANFYVLVSESPFPSGNLRATLDNPSVWHQHIQRAPGKEITVPVSAKGRYLRIQLAGQNWLSLAEVEVIGGTGSTNSAITPQNEDGLPVTIYWHMADDADLYLNGKALRNYSPSFKTRRDEAPLPPFSARAVIKNGDIFTVGGRRGGSFGLMLIAVDDSGRVVYKTDRDNWAVYEPGERSDWFDPSVAISSGRRAVTVQPDPWYPQKALNAKHNNSALSIWSEPSNRFAHMLGIVRLD